MTRISRQFPDVRVPQTRPLARLRARARTGGALPVGVVVGVVAVVVVVGAPAVTGGRVWAQVKPGPVKVAAAVSTQSTAESGAGSTRVAAGVDPDAARTPDTTLAPRITTKNRTKSVKVRLAAASFPSAAEILANRSIVLSEQARADITAGLIDPRVLGTLGALAKRSVIEVRVLRSGHSRYVQGTNRESNHFYGRGADITKVDGSPVSRANQSALSLANFLLTLPGDIRPDELGSPWSGNGASADVEVFTDEGHDDHIHFGFND